MLVYPPQPLFTAWLYGSPCPLNPIQTVGQRASQSHSLTVSHSGSLIEGDNKGVFFLSLSWPGFCCRRCCWWCRCWRGGAGGRTSRDHRRAGLPFHLLTRSKSGARSGGTCYAAYNGGNQRSNIKYFISKLNCWSSRISKPGPGWKVNKESTLRIFLLCKPRQFSKVPNGIIFSAVSFIAWWRLEDNGGVCWCR